MRLIVILISLMLLPFVTIGQSAFSIKPLIAGYHPYADPNSRIAPNKIGQDGTFAAEPGLLIGYENYIINPNMGFKAHAGFFKDNGNANSIIVHAGYRLRSSSGNQSINITIGPSFFMRQPWANVPEYQAQDFWNAGGGWENKIMWLSGEIELLYAFTPKHRLNVSFNHTAPQTFTFTVGYSYWLERVTKGKRTKRKRPKTFKKRKRRRRR